MRNNITDVTRIQGRDRAAHSPYGRRRLIDGMYRAPRVASRVMIIAIKVELIAAILPHGQATARKCRTELKRWAEYVRLLAGEKGLPTLNDGIDVIIHLMRRYD